MNDKQKQIEEMAYSICTANRKLIKSCRECPIFQGDKYLCVKKEFAERFYNVGCRMQSDTAREIVKELKFLYVERQKEYTNWDGNKINAVATEWLNADIECIAAQHGVEVKHD